MTCHSMMDTITYSDTDVIVVGVSSACFSYAYELSKNPSIRAAIIKQSSRRWRMAWWSIILGHVVQKPAHM